MVIWHHRLQIRTQLALLLQLLHLQLIVLNGVVSVGDVNANRVDNVLIVKIGNIINYIVFKNF